ncbi:MAG TPA: hypothetical protein P5229_00235 [Candidatus Gracilibacteria bacterium]|nr:hypothetical protein [Candidatus Gracilibacteria bacterium]HRY90759.1 hypothetical protein [Candidatus Gracilibacteria bacterium]
MCFSATASFIAGGSLTLAGKGTLKKVREKSDIPFASIPLLFGIQQTIEGLVWLSFSSPVYASTLNHLFSFAFTLFAYVLWPIFVPIAIYLMERDQLRSRILKLFIAIGLIAGLYLLYTMIRVPVTSQIIQHSISYSNAATGYPIFIMYLISTCLSCLVSSHRMVNIFGVTLFASCFFAFQCYANAFFSVWCFFAALLSVIVYLHFTVKVDVIQNIKNFFRIA